MYYIFNFFIKKVFTFYNIVLPILSTTNLIGKSIFLTLIYFCLNNLDLSNLFIFPIVISSLFIENILFMTQYILDLYRYLVLDWIEFSKPLFSTTGPGLGGSGSSSGPSYGSNAEASSSRWGSGKPDDPIVIDDDDEEENNDKNNEENYQVNNEQEERDTSLEHFQDLLDKRTEYTKIYEERSREWNLSNSEVDKERTNIVGEQLDQIDDEIKELCRTEGYLDPQDLPNDPDEVEEE
jgi:hypothetical protein